MAKGISINFLADVKDFLRGTKNVEDSLDDVADSLDDVVKEGEQATGKLEDSFRDLAKATKKSGDDVGDNLNRGFKKAEDGAQNFKEEANSTAKESAASFDGSAQSIVDSFQEIAANAFEGFGPAGAVAGLALAAGIGIATAEFQKSEEAAKAAKVRVSELGKAFIESGADVAQVEAFQSALEGIVSNADDATVKVDDLRKMTKKYGDAVPSVSEFAVAYAGNADAIDSVTKKLEAAIKAEEDKNYTTKVGAEQSQKRQDAYQGEIDKLQKVAEETELAKQIEADWLASGGAESQAKAAAIDTINQAYDDVVSSVSDFVNSETGILDVEAYLAAIDARSKALDDYQTNLAKSGLSTEQKDALNGMGVEAASAWLAGYQSATPEQQRKLKASLTESAKENSGVARKTLDDAFQKPVEAKVKAIADTQAAQTDLDNLIKARTAIIKVDFQDRYGKKVY